MRARHPTRCEQRMHITRKASPYAAPEIEIIDRQRKCIQAAVARGTDELRAESTLAAALQPRQPNAQRHLGTYMNKRSQDRVDDGRGENVTRGSMACSHRKLLCNGLEQTLSGSVGDDSRPAR